jgi:hypothetical protein
MLNLLIILANGRWEIIRCLKGYFGGKGNVYVVACVWDVRGFDAPVECGAAL